MLGETHQHLLLIEHIPGTGAVTEAVHFVPQQMLPLRPDHLTRGIPVWTTGQQVEAGIVHLVQVKDVFQTDDQHEDAGQKSVLKGSVVIGEALLGDVPPADHLGQQQVGTGILVVAKKNRWADAASAGPRRTARRALLAASVRRWPDGVVQAP